MRLFPCFLPAIGSLSIGEDPEGEKGPDRQAARDAAVAQARGLIAEGAKTGADRRGWCVEVMGRAVQRVLTVAFSDTLAAKAPTSRDNTMTGGDDS
ncbi:hypothetical protein [Microvirga sp. TS319]|uniref:DUF6894 family protein n=1 Tax=Microvirga sp. TS319 TaxID=3241165 RepID=UPI00351AA6A8